LSVNWTTSDVGSPFWPADRFVAPPATVLDLRIALDHARSDNDTLRVLLHAILGPAYGVGNARENNTFALQSPLNLSGNTYAILIALLAERTVGTEEQR
jgi:hypothetical protein